MIPIHQSEPIFVLAASILIFHAIPTSWQVAGFAMIVVGILILCMSRQTIRGLGHPRHVVVLLVSAFFGAVSTVISDEILQLKSLESVLIFNFAGYALGGMLLLLVPKWRRLITNDLKTLNFKHFGIFGVTNIFDVGGYVFFMAALAAGGGAALVSVVVSIHPLFVLAFGFLATKLFPKFIAEDIAPGGVVRKFLSIVIIVVGVAVISHQAI